MSASSSSVTTVPSRSTRSRIVCFTPPCGGTPWIASESGDATPLLHLSTCPTCKKPSSLVYILLQMAAVLEAQQNADAAATDCKAIAAEASRLFEKARAEYGNLCKKVFASIVTTLDPAVRLRGQTSRTDPAYLKACVNVLRANVTVYREAIEEIESKFKPIFPHIDSDLMQAIDLHAINMVADCRPEAQPSLARAQGRSGKMVKVRPLVYDYGLPPSSSVPYCCVFPTGENTTPTLAAIVSLRVVCQRFIDMLPLKPFDLRIDPKKSELISLKERGADAEAKAPSITSTGIIDPHISEATQQTVDVALERLWHWFGDFREACMELNSQVLRYLATKTNGAALLRAAKKFQSTFPYSAARCEDDDALWQQKKALAVSEHLSKLIPCLEAKTKDDAAILRLVDDEALRDISPLVPSNVIWVPKCDGVLTFPVVLGPVDIPYTLDLSRSLHCLYGGAPEDDDTIDTRRKRLLVQHLANALDDARASLIRKAELEVRADDAKYEAKANTLALATAQSEARAIDATKARFSSARRDAGLEEAKAAALSQSNVLDHKTRIKKELMDKAIQARLDRFTWTDFYDHVEQFFEPLAYNNLQGKIKRLRKQTSRSQASMPASSLEPVLEADEMLTKIARTYLVNEGRGPVNKQVADNLTKAFLMHITNNFFWHAVPLDGKEVKNTKNKKSKASKKKKPDEGISSCQCLVQVCAGVDKLPNMRINIPFSMFSPSRPHGLLNGKVMDAIQAVLYAIRVRPRELALKRDA